MTRNFQQSHPNKPSLSILSAVLVTFYNYPACNIKIKGKEEKKEEKQFSDEKFSTVVFSEQEPETPKKRKRKRKKNGSNMQNQDHNLYLSKMRALRKKSICNWSCFVWSLMRKKGFCGVCITFPPKKIWWNLFISRGQFLTAFFVPLPFFQVHSVQCGK